jgi:two-component system sensor histidine kinase EvgS
MLRIPSIELELSGYSYITPVPVYLSEDDKRWLLQKRVLRVGVYQPEQAPLVQTTLSGRYRGMNADYLMLIHYSLNIRIAVLSYKNRADAIRALRAGEIDTVLTGLDTFPFAEEGIQLSEPLVHSWPVLVTSLSNVMSPLQSPRTSRIAVVEGYPGADFIHEAFPNAEIANYASYQEALNSVITGQNRWFMGDSLTTSTWLSQEFSQALSTVKYWPSPQKMSHFLFLPAQDRLLNIINSTINAIDENQHGQIAQSMIDKGNLSFCSNRSI